MKSNVLTIYFIPLAGSFVTAFQVIDSFIPCIILMVAAVASFVYFLIMRKKSRQDAVVALVCAGIMLVFSSVGLIRPLRNAEKARQWNKYIQDDKDYELERLMAHADLDDATSLLELSDYFYENLDYEQARFYAQKAADRGSAEGYRKLVIIDMYGLGRKADTVQAVSNMRRGQKVDNVIFVYDSALVKSLPRADIVKLEEGVRKHERITKIGLSFQDAIVTRGSASALKVIEDNRSEITDYANDDYAPAIELLYDEGILKSEGKLIHEYAKQLFAVGYLPTSPLRRHSLLKMVIKYDCFVGQYQTLIRFKDYLFPALSKPQDYDRKVFTDSLLVNEYILFRAQADWYKSLYEERAPVRTLILDDVTDYEGLYKTSMKLLSENIRAINYRKDHYDEYIRVEEPMADYGFKFQ